MVGVILYEFIVGTPPFNADTPKAIFHNVVNKEVEWPPDEAFVESELDPPTSELKDFVHRLLMKDPEQRLGSTHSTQLFKNDETFEIKVCCVC